jgi:salicylate hydroxylase
VSPTLSSWAITLRDLTEAQETWRLYSPAELVAHRDELCKTFETWSSPVPELIAQAERMTKYGLYDRPELEPTQWYCGRCLLIGDAAHPTSPHLGQGANQAL